MSGKIMRLSSAVAVRIFQWSSCCCRWGDELACPSEEMIMQIHPTVTTTTSFKSSSSSSWSQSIHVLQHQWVSQSDMLRCWQSANICRILAPDSLPCFVLLTPSFWQCLCPALCSGLFSWRASCRCDRKYSKRIPVWASTSFVAA